MGLTRPTDSPDAGQTADRATGAQSPNPAQRRTWARAMPDTVEANTTLAAHLAGESDPSVWAAALTTLANHHEGGVARMLLPYLASEDAALRNEVIRTLTTMPDAVVDELPSLMGDEDSDVRILSVTMLGHLHHPQVPDWLAEVARTDPHPNVVGAALAELVDLGGPQQADAFVVARRRFPEDPFIAYVAEQAEERLL